MIYQKFLIILLLLLNSCEEIPPVINPLAPQSGCNGANKKEVENQKRQVLIEEFTGVKCVNCPDGSKVIEELINIYGEQLIAVSIHAGFFAPPYPESQYDFTTPEGNNLIDFLGSPFGYPSAVVNRKLFPGEFDLQVGKNLWPGLVAKELEEAPLIKIHLETLWNPSSLTSDVEVTLFPESSDLEFENLRLTVLLIENGIKDLQLVPGMSDPDPDYLHQHVFRSTFTNFSGNPLQASDADEEKICYSFSEMLKPEWVAENCEVVAFISQAGEVKDVIQAHKVKLVN